MGVTQINPNTSFTVLNSPKSKNSLYKICTTAVCEMILTTGGSFSLASLRRMTGRCAIIRVLSMFCFNYSSPLLSWDDDKEEASVFRSTVATCKLLDGSF